MDRICDRISIVVKESRLTKSEFAKRINVSQPHVSRMCSGETQPSDRTISDICREFDVNENWLRHGIGEMKAETTQRQKLTRFFADVLATCPDERSAFVAALDDLPPEFGPMVAELARNYADNLKKEEAEP